MCREERCKRQYTTHAYHLRAAACLAYCLPGGRPKDGMIKKSPPPTLQQKIKVMTAPWTGSKFRPPARQCPTTCVVLGGNIGFRQHIRPVRRTHTQMQPRSVTCNDPPVSVGSKQMSSKWLSARVLCQVINFEESRRIHARKPQHTHLRNPRCTILNLDASSQMTLPVQVDMARASRCEPCC